MGFISKGKIVKSKRLYAPILIITHTRINHLKNTIDSLLNCVGAEKTDLYVASDGAARESDKPIVLKIRKYLKSVKGFKSVNVIEREKNFGAFDNGFEAKHLLLKKYGCLIPMEDDLLLGRGFLNYVNDGLKEYWDDSSVIGISAYLSSTLDGKYKNYFLSEHRSPYASGMWHHKEIWLDKIRLANVARDFLNDRSWFVEFSRACRYARTLPQIASGEMRAGDIEYSMIMLKYNLTSLYAPQNMVRHAGADGTGVHSVLNDEIQNQPYSNKLMEKINIEKTLFLPKAHAEDSRDELSNFRSAIDLFIFYLSKYVPFSHSLLGFMRFLKKKYLPNFLG